MKILVYGAGPLGSLFAARLQAGGHDVSLLARGQRLVDLRKHGIVLVDYNTDEKTISSVSLVERLDPQDAYDLVLVVMRKNKALEILPTLAANHHTPNILFLMNNAAGPNKLVASLGQERVMTGFPMAAGYRHGHQVTYLTGAQPGKPVLIPIGEADGSITPRIQMVGQVLASMPGFGAEIRTDMDAWLKTHVALLMPSLVPAMRAAGSDNVRMAHTRDLVVLAVRAIREGFCVLRALGYPITPNSVQRYELIPEPILVWVLQRRLVDPRIRVAMLEHAAAAQDEIKHLADEFMALAHKTNVPTPTIDRLYDYFDPATPLMPEGSSEIPLDWRSVWVGLTVMSAFLGLSMLFIKRYRR